MAAPENATLLRLGQTDLALAQPAEDIRGRKVVDSNGDDIGDVEELLIDDTEKRVRFIEVASGGFLGIGETRFLIPVDAIKKIDNSVIHVDRTRQDVMSAPHYDPELINEDYFTRVYTYYGFGPFWAPGYAYPMYPFYI
jgi:sporulation protein YlmC with PRC-barrel domain